LLDFLYADHERVASFLAQLYGAGAPKETERTASKGKKTQNKGSLKLGLAEGELAGERDWAQEIRSSYDPLWSNSQKLIEHVQEGGSSAETSDLDIGQLKIFSGKLLAYDLSSITPLMNADAMEDFIANGISDDVESSGRSNKARNAEKKKEAAVIREFLRALPLGIGFVLVTDRFHFWFSVKREYLSLYDLDIPLKFPTHISGTWNVLGVVDALANDHVEGLASVISRNIDGLIPSMVINMMQLTGATAGLFGRPLQAYGLSPLVVFRRICA
jgi:hypothetical protein